MFRNLLGPELFWLLIYGLVSYLAARNVPSTPAGDKLLLALYWQLPLLAIPLAFMFFFIPEAGRSGLFLRTNVACLLGLYFALTKGLDAHGEQGPGIGTAWIIGMMLGIIVLGVMDVVVKVARG